MLDLTGLDEVQFRMACTDKNGRVSEPKIASLLIEQNKMVSLHGVPYNEDGIIPEAALLKPIAEVLVFLDESKNVANRAQAVKRLAIQLSSVDEIPVIRHEVPFQNGTLIIKSDGTHRFVEDKHPAPYRLNCDYDPKAADLTWFNHWKNIMYEEDWDCFQEIMGYLLLPVTYGQFAFFLLGPGGCGKSVWGCILRRIFGGAMTAVKIHALEENRFAPAVLENKLVGYDDDLDGAAMKKTDLFKIITTAKQPIQAERKGIDLFEFQPYARLCACGNFALRSLHDTSDAFIRRLLPIKVKDPIEKSAVIPDLEERIYPEVSAIVNWALEGLERLIRNNYQFSISQRSRNLIEEMREDSNSILPFIDDELEFDPGYRMTTGQLTSIYDAYCRREDKTARQPKTVINYFKENSDRLHIQYTKHARGDSRGFVGMKWKKDNTQKPARKPTLDLDEIFKGG